MSVVAAKEVQFLMDVLGEEVLKSSPVILRLEDPSVKDTETLKAFVEDIGQAPNVRNEINM